MAAKGKWAQGIKPRHFHWIIQDQLAVCERPGGFGANHRKVRRQEEIIWIREQGFDLVVSVSPAPHNLHNYDELGVTWQHRPFGNHDDAAPYLLSFFPELRDLLAAKNKVLIHGEELGDRLSGIIAGYLVWSELLPTGPKAISLTERLLARQLGPVGRELVTVALDLPRASA